MVVFIEHKTIEKQLSKNEKAIPGKKDSTIVRLREEIQSIRAELIKINSDKEKAFRKLQETNEDILSSNEEFQCMNEELETSKEEIESANEELLSSNQELQTRNEQLSEAYEFSDAIVNTMHEPMLILDLDLRIRSANQAFYRKFMLSVEHTEGKMLYEISSGEWDIPALRSLLLKIGKKDITFHEYELGLNFHSIGKRTILLNARRIVQKSGAEQLILLALTDITETAQKRKIEKQRLEEIISQKTLAIANNYKLLEEKNIALTKMNKELETFTFLSSHDLQEPLRKIKNFASCLIAEEHKALSRDGKMYLLRMQETVLRMQRLLEDLLSYSRVKTSIQSFEKTKIAKLLKELLSDFDDQIKEKKATVTISGNTECPIIRFQVRQLFYNLFSNSLKFSHERRKLHIKIKIENKLAEKLDNDHLLPEKMYCHICFSDNGIGFDPQYSERIFEVFQRLHEYEEYKGTGIGLAICKRIVENHNGYITASGKVNHGSKFDIYLPVEIFSIKPANLKITHASF